MLIKRDGDSAPTKHQAVANRFGYHAYQSADPTRVDLAALLRQGLKERIRSDYDQTWQAEEAEATAIVRSARNFIEVSARLDAFELPPPFARDE